MKSDDFKALFVPITPEEQSARPVHKVVLSSTDWHGQWVDAAFLREENQRQVALQRQLTDQLRVQQNKQLNLNFSTITS